MSGTVSSIKYRDRVSSTVPVVWMKDQVCLSVRSGQKVIQSSSPRAPQPRSCKVVVGQVL